MLVKIGGPLVKRQSDRSVQVAHVVQKARGIREDLTRVAIHIQVVRVQVRVRDLDTERRRRASGGRPGRCPAMSSRSCTTLSSKRGRRRRRSVLHNRLNPARATGL